MCKTFTRTEIEEAIRDPVLVALTDLGVPTDADHVRRLLRALVSLGAEIMLDSGASPEFVAQQCSQAIAGEVERRKKAANTIGKLFGPCPLAQA